MKTKAKFISKIRNPQFLTMLNTSIYNRLMYIDWGIRNKVATDCAQRRFFTSGFNRIITSLMND